MTVRKIEIEEIGKRKSVNVWKCETCTKFHVKVGNLLLNFTPPEFSEFVNETWNCFYDKKFDLTVTN